MLSQDFSTSTIKRYILLIVREHAETILGSGITDEEAIEETTKFILELQRFASQCILTDAKQSSWPSTNKGHEKNNFLFRITDVHSLEEAVVSPELGLKGNVDALVNVVLSSDVSRTTHRLMGMELKTGHNQNVSQAHIIQLSLYILMLQARYAINQRNYGGILMYLNNEGQKAVHITPTSNELKSLISIRNHIVNETKKSLEPRGIIASRTKQKDERSSVTDIEVLPAPPTVLPDLIPSVHSCNYCYANNFCMLYSRCDIELSKFSGAGHHAEGSSQYVAKTHSHLLQHYTGHLSNLKEFEYFRDWDRMIDLEAHEYKNDLVKAWLRPSIEQEKETLSCISSVTWCNSAISDVENTGLTADSHFLLRFFRTTHPTTLTLVELNIDVDDIVVVSTDGNIYGRANNVQPVLLPQFKHKVHIVRGHVHDITDNSISITASQQDFAQLKRTYAMWEEATVRNGLVDTNNTLLFRIDKDEISSGAALLRQNLANLFLSDVKPFSIDQQKQKADSFESISRKESVSRLRDCIVNLSAVPQFENTEQQRNMFSIPPGKSFSPIRGCDFTDLFMEYLELNSDQQQAVAKVWMFSR